MCLEHDREQPTPWVVQVTATAYSTLAQCATGTTQPTPQPSREALQVTLGRRHKAPVHYSGKAELLARIGSISLSSPC